MSEKSLILYLKMHFFFSDMTLFINRLLFSTNHKNINTLYLFFGFAAGIRPVRPIVLLERTYNTINLSVIHYSINELLTSYFYLYNHYV